MAAYRAVEGWVRAWEVPVKLDESSLPEASGAAVVLRLHGDLIGRGAAVGEGRGAIVAAARAALGEASRRLPAQNDVLYEETVKRLAAEITISLELAGEMIPLGVRTFELASGEINPGIDGVAARIGEKTSPIFPSSILSLGMTPRLALSGAAAQVSGDPTLGLADLETLLDVHKVVLYRFRTTHLAQTAPGAAPIFLTRGGRVVGLGELSGAELRSMADRIAEHMLTKRWPGREPFGLVGSYDPCRDVYDPRLASPIEQLTTCLSLVRYASLLGPQTLRARELVAFVDQTLTDLITVEAGEENPTSDLAAAAAWVVLDAERRDLDIDGAPPCPAECPRAVLGAYDLSAGFVTGVARPVEPLVALALVELARAERPGVLRKEGIMLAESAVRRVFRDAAPGGLVAEMPWLGWAELRLAALKGEDGTEIPSAVGLRQMRRTIWEHQVGMTDEAARETRVGGTDMVGGIVFDTGASGGGRLPTWQTARALAFAATMLADDRLTPTADKPLELAKLLGGLRFLRQLQADESTEWMYQSRRRSYGGIRAAAWDQRMPPDASSMTLMTLCESLRALNAMER